MHGIKNNFVCMPAYYKQKVKYKDKDHKCDDRFHEHDCSKCAQNPSQNTTFSKFIAREANENTFQMVNENKHNKVNDEHAS